MTGRNLHLLMVGAMVSVNLVMPISAQEADPTAALALSCFQESLVSSDSIPACAEGPALEEIILVPARFSARTVSAVLDGLEEFAVSSHRRNHVAANRLSVAGIPGAPGSGRPLSGIVDRLVSIYQSSSDSIVKGVIVGGMARQVDRSRTMEFLERVAGENTTPAADKRWPSIAFQALIELELMGAEGRDVLRKLHAGGHVQEKAAREYLDGLALYAFGESYPKGCPPRKGPIPRPFEPSHPEALIGTYDLVMVSKWHDEDGVTRIGRMDLWATDSLRCCNTPQYLWILDSVVGKQRYGHYDYDSITGWHPILDDQHERRLLGAINIDLRGMSLGTEAELDRLSSRDPQAPGLVWRRGKLVLAPVRSGFVQMDGATSWLDVDSLSDDGFWGDWHTAFSIWSLTDELGRVLPDPSGNFCAMRRED